MRCKLTDFCDRQSIRRRIFKLDSDSPMFVSRNLPLIVPILIADKKDVFYFLFYFFCALY